MAIMFNFSTLFNSVAPHYEDKILPILKPLAQSLIEWAAPYPNGQILDVGTGTGIVARLIAPSATRVFAVDMASQMVYVAKQKAKPLENVQIIQADNHALPFADNSFDVVISSFGLNATHPRRVFKEIWRVLKPNGKFILQEWSILHTFDRIVIETIEVFMVDDEDAPIELVQLRNFLAEDNNGWYSHIQTQMDYADELRAAGFNRLLITEGNFSHIKLDLNTFIKYKLAWTSLASELAAMDPSARGDCLDKMRSELQYYLDNSGMLNYAPSLFRVQASKPHLS
ncbi:MAG: hypothetical protein CUN55_13695 [Phototrophicales bacterium]|nr:MAG: hypothetical protein CUN55_13695 [Phototrophicales bacterium]